MFVLKMVSSVKNDCYDTDIGRDQFYKILSQFAIHKAKTTCYPVCIYPNGLEIHKGKTLLRQFIRKVSSEKDKYVMYEEIVTKSTNIECHNEYIDEYVLQETMFASKDVSISFETCIYPSSPQLHKVVIYSESADNCIAMLNRILKR